MCALDATADSLLYVTSDIVIRYYDIVIVFVIDIVIDIVLYCIVMLLYCKCYCVVL